MTTIYVMKCDKHYLFEDNRISTILSLFKREDIFVFMTTIIHFKVAFNHDWHWMLVPVFVNATHYLKKIAEKVKILDDQNSLDSNVSNDVSKTHEYELCVLSKAHRIISRSIINVESFEILFYQVTFDLMLLQSTMNRDKWIFHLVCHFIDFNLIYTHSRKFNVVRILIEIFNMIETRFKRKIMFFRLNEERIFDTEFDNLIISKKITYEFSTSILFEQNDYFERKDAILTMKARTLKIDVDSFEYLWSKLIRTIDYLANRTFMTKHEWKTSYELMIEKSSNLSHLHQYDCKVYSSDKHITKKRKLQERAHIEHLMKYEASNIFRIWISSQRKIIKIQDVLFDEKSKYDAHDVDLI